MLPYKRLSETFLDLFKIRLSQGTIANIIISVEAKSSDAVQPIYSSLSTADVMHCDETACRVHAKKNWLHVASNSDHSYYHIDEKRGVKALENIGLLKDYEGTQIHDCLSAYSHYTKCKHGICNDHLRELIHIEEQLEQAWSTDMKDLLLDSQAQREKRFRVHARNKKSDQETLSINSRRRVESKS